MDNNNSVYLFLNHIRYVHLGTSIAQVIFNKINPFPKVNNK